MTLCFNASCPILELLTLLTLHFFPGVQTLVGQVFCCLDVVTLLAMWSGLGVVQGSCFPVLAGPVVHVMSLATTYMWAHPVPPAITHHGLPA